MKNTIGIVGGGIVGGAVKAFFRDAKVYDKHKKMETIDEVACARFVFICVPTPYENGLDLTHVDDAVQNVVKHMTRPNEQMIVIKSTALPGTTESYQKRYPETNFAFNPEFLRDQSAVADFVKNDRQIVGYTQKSKDTSLPQDLLDILPPAPYQKLMPATSAEMIKYAGNTFLAMQVIFANQIFDICESAGINYDEVKESVKADKRAGPSHWEIWHTESSTVSTKGETYRGYGGKCFPKDINSLIAEGEKIGVDVSLFQAARQVNLRLNGGKYDK